MKKRAICLALTMVFSAVGLYSSVYLAKMHYKKPHHQLTLIDTLPFMERYFPRDKVEAAVKSLDALSDINIVNPFDNPDFDPYAAAMNAPAPAASRATATVPSVIPVSINRIRPTQSRTHRIASAINPSLLPLRMVARMNMASFPNAAMRQYQPGKV